MIAFPIGIDEYNVSECVRRKDDCDTLCMSWRAAATANIALYVYIFLFECTPFLLDKPTEFESSSRLHDSYS